MRAGERIPPSCPQNAQHHQTAAKKSYAENDQIRQLFLYILNTLYSKLPGDVFLNAHDLGLLEGDGNKQVIAATLNYIYISSIKMSIITSEDNYKTEVLAAGQNTKGYFSPKNSVILCQGTDDISLTTSLLSLPINTTIMPTASTWTITFMH